jgi:hypothetical protein
MPPGFVDEKTRRIAFEIETRTPVGIEIAGADESDAGLAAVGLILPRVRRRAYDRRRLAAWIGELRQKLRRRNEARRTIGPKSDACE